MLTATLFTFAKIQKQTNCPSKDEWIKNHGMCIHTHTHTQTHTHTHRMEYYSATKRMKLSFTATWIDLEGIMLSEISQTEKDKHCTIPLICGI